MTLLQEVKHLKVEVLILWILLLPGQVAAVLMTWQLVEVVAGRLLQLPVLLYLPALHQRSKLPAALRVL